MQPGGLGMLRGSRMLQARALGGAAGSWQQAASRQWQAAHTTRRGASRRSAVAVEQAPTAAPVGSATPIAIKVRFAPSPTGMLHVGGARTALFNWLYARKMGGKFVLRIEDTDAARSTRESEEAVLTDLRWLGLDWDEGPDVGGPNGPYRQSERTAMYKAYVDRLVAEGVAYPCFCTDEELEAMKAEAAAKQLPPIYRGKWAGASAEEVQAARDAGLPCCYRFRVPPGQEISINDIVRGSVTWNTDTLGDFVILRSNGLPVYNFCVAVDDALMGITHVLRAEEHLPNTLRQVLIYRALGFTPPSFGHMSLILAPDKSKLSKRHGATSVGEFKAQGFLAPAMVNYLSLLGWNDGTEKEIFSTSELQDAFTLERITKSAAVFDKVKLSWMNGQHLRSLPEERLVPMIAEHLVARGLLTNADSPFALAVANIMKGSLELVNDAEAQLGALLGYPLEETAASEAFQAIKEDGFGEVVMAVLAAWDSGELAAALSSGHDGYKKWVTGWGKSVKRKGKRLFMPMRVAFTGSMQGPDVGDILGALGLESGDVVDRSGCVDLAARMARLRAWAAADGVAA